MGEFVSVSLDQSSISFVKDLARFQTFLDPMLSEKLQAIAEIISNAAVTNTWSAFQNPTGLLASTIEIIRTSSLSIEIGSDSPYARRLELGFNGTDSLGRTYNNPAEPYLTPALDENSDLAMQEMMNAVTDAFALMGIRI
ncbi:MAG TPA: hypothetical protein VL443_08330 [Cyclobacteriaceae bacterium]|jgi:hypothetical protein|nr:hypothetical protein [Cyclobacteriaceae bacterium]